MEAVEALVEAGEGVDRVGSVTDLGVSFRDDRGRSASMMLAQAAEEAQKKAAGPPPLHVDPIRSGREHDDRIKGKEGASGDSTGSVASSGEGSASLKRTERRHGRGMTPGGYLAKAQMLRELLVRLQGLEVEGGSGNSLAVVREDGGAGGSARASPAGSTGS